jgi:insertion element IS1 protein InsB
MWINRYKKNGHTRHGKQNHQCKTCECQVVATAEDCSIADERRTLIEHLLRERISLRGTCRAVGVSFPWLLHFMVERFATCPDDLHVRVSPRPTDVVLRRLEAEADEIWSFVTKKANKQWIWTNMARPCVVSADYVHGFERFKALASRYHFKLSRYKR